MKRHAERVAQSFSVELEETPGREARRKRAENHGRMPAFAEAVVARESEARVQLNADRVREQEILA